MKVQEEKSEAHVALQPKNMEKNSVQLIMAMDIAGYGTGEIATELQMTQGRISIIKNSPLYIEQRAVRFNSLKDQVVRRTAEQITDNPARAILTDPVVQEAAAREKIKLALDERSPFVRNAATSEILAFGGLLPKKGEDRDSKTTVIMEEKLAKRFGFAKEYEATKTVTIIKEVA